MKNLKDNLLRKERKQLREIPSEKHQEAIKYVQRIKEIGEKENLTKEDLEEVKKLIKKIEGIYSPEIKKSYENYECLKNLKNHVSYVYSVIESHDGKQIIFGSGIILLKSGKRKFEKQFYSKKGEYKVEEIKDVNNVHFQPDGTLQILTILSKKMGKKEWEFIF